MKNEMLRIRIAANILYRICPNIRIEGTDADVCDLLCDVNGMRFAVEVKSSTFAKSSEFQRYIERLKAKSFNFGVERVPIALMAVNESTEEARIGFVLIWRLTKVIINKNVSLHTINDKTWNVFMDNLKAMEETIMALSRDTISVIKSIIIKEKDYMGIEHRANMVYLRKFHNGYKMEQKEYNDVKERMDRLTYGTPQEEYPDDQFDEDVIKMIKKNYSSADVKNSLLLYNKQLDNLRSEINRMTYTKTLRLVIRPKLDECMYDMIESVFELPTFKIFLYCNSQADSSYFTDRTIINEVPMEKWKATYKFYSSIEETIITDIKSITFM